MWPEPASRVLSAAIPPQRGWHGNEESGQKGWVRAGLGLVARHTQSQCSLGWRGRVALWSHGTAEAQLLGNLLLPLLDHWGGGRFQIHFCLIPECSFH